MKKSNTSTAKDPHYSSQDEGGNSESGTSQGKKVKVSIVNNAMDVGHSRSPINNLSRFVTTSPAAMNSRGNRQHPFRSPHNGESSDDENSSNNDDDRQQLKPNMARQPSPRQRITNSPGITSRKHPSNSNLRDSIQQENWRDMSPSSSIDVDHDNKRGLSSIPKPTDKNSNVSTFSFVTGDLEDVESVSSIEPTPKKPESMDQPSKMTKETLQSETNDPNEKSKQVSESNEIIVDDYGLQQIPASDSLEWDDHGSVDNDSVVVISSDISKSEIPESNFPRSPNKPIKPSNNSELTSTNVSYQSSLTGGSVAKRLSSANQSFDGSFYLSDSSMDDSFYLDKNASKNQITKPISISATSNRDEGITKNRLPTQTFRPVNQVNANTTAASSLNQSNIPGNSSFTRVSSNTVDVSTSSKEPDPSQSQVVHDKEQQTNIKPVKTTITSIVVTSSATKKENHQDEVPPVVVSENVNVVNVSNPTPVLLPVTETESQIPMANKHPDRRTASDESRGIMSHSSGNASMDKYPDSITDSKNKEQIHTNSHDYPIKLPLSRSPSNATTPPLPPLNTSLTSLSASLQGPLRASSPSNMNRADSSRNMALSGYRSQQSSQELNSSNEYNQGIYQSISSGHVQYPTSSSVSTKVPKPVLSTMQQSLHTGFEEHFSPPPLSEFGVRAGVLLESWLEKKSKRTGFWNKVITRPGVLIYNKIDADHNIALLEILRLE